ncbi:MAG: formylglycine-generating enzyme family protein [Phycisphaerae bacterium]|jgi:formylglycine-generating enzyme required for sulfatase activity|nr:formylglycine-generating enzyme family protein [Phycisphaerae bacterium]
MNRISLISLVVFCCLVGGLAAERKVKVAAPAASKIPSWAKVSKAQVAEAKKLGIPVAFENAVGVKFVLVPAGEFMMGSADDEVGRYKVEGPQHKVKIAKAFYVAIHQVTQGQWKSVMNTKPWKGKSGAKDDPANVVNWVNWNDATSFCAALEKKDGRSYRLLSEAQWEYSCRAGSTTRYFYGDDLKLEKLGDYGWWGKKGWWDRKDKYVRPPGLKKPNAWGLYDMIGSVWEMCMDVMHKNYEGAPTDGSAWMTGAPSDTEPGHPLRGGGSHSDHRRVRSASRHSYRQSHKSHYVGFRVCCPIPAKAK